MRIIKNIGTDRVYDELRSSLTPPALLNLASPVFSLFAYAELRDLLEKLGGCRVVLQGNDNDLGLTGNCSFGTEGLGITPGNQFSLIQCSEGEDESATLRAWFTSIWNSLPADEQYKNALLARLQELASPQPASLIYYLTLFQIFKDLGDELDEERIVKSATGNRNTTVWKKLYKFQRDGVIGAIDKLERLGGCIIDVGFRVFKLASSNIRAWEPNRDDLPTTLQESIEHLKSDRTEQDIFFELLLKLGLDLTVPMERKTIAGKAVHSVGAGTLLACMAEKIAASEVESLGLGIVAWHKTLSPAGDTTIVFRDSAFAGDVAKTNLTAILQQYGLENVRSL
jgi:hypothetical protein